MMDGTLFDARMTTPEGATFVRREQQTAPGMASWGGEGPPSATCRECIFWAAKKYKRDFGHLRRRRCRKFRKMMGGKCGQAVAPEMPACRFFEANEKAPLLDIKQEERVE